MITQIKRYCKDHIWQHILICIIAQDSKISISVLKEMKKIVLVNEVTDIYCVFYMFVYLVQNMIKHITSINKAYYEALVVTAIINILKNMTVSDYLTGMLSYFSYQYDRLLRGYRNIET